MPWKLPSLAHAASWRSHASRKSAGPIRSGTQPELADPQPAGPLGPGSMKGTFGRANGATPITAPPPAAGRAWFSTALGWTPPITAEYDAGLPADDCAAVLLAAGWEGTDGRKTGARTCIRHLQSTRGRRERPAAARVEHPVFQAADGPLHNLQGTRRSLRSGSHATASDAPAQRNTPRGPVGPRGVSEHIYQARVNQARTFWMIARAVSAEVRIRLEISEVIRVMRDWSCWICVVIRNRSPSLRLGLSNCLRRPSIDS